MKRHWLLVILLALTCVTVEAQTVYFESPDVATNLPEGGQTIFVPWDIVKNDLGSYAVGTSLPAPAPLDAVHRLSVSTRLVRPR